jgi:hypothetical protein
VPYPDSSRAVSADDASGQYEQRYVAYLDILGFSELVRKQPGTPVGAFGAALASISSSMLRSRSELFPSSQPKCWRGHWFSDTVLLIGDDSETSLGVVLSEIHTLIVELLVDYRVLVRGAVVHGSIYTHGDLLFGPALIEAHELAEEVAVYPRVVLPNELGELELVHREMEHPVSDRRFAVAKDGDGQHYLDMLAANVDIVRGAALSDAEHVKRSHLLSQVTMVVEEGLRMHASRPRVLAKYRWLETKLDEVRSQAADVGS